MFRYDRSLVICAARSILEQGGWCVLERCVDIPRQQWETTLLVFDIAPEGVADAIEEELEHEREYDARLSGCDRRTLGPDPGMGAYLCYLADTQAPAGASPARSLVSSG